MLILRPGQGQVRYCLKTAYRDGSTHILLEHLDSIDVDTAFGYPDKRTLWRIAETQRGSRDLKLHAYLTGVRDAYR